MRVWLAEKSSFGRDLAKALGNEREVPGIMNAYDTAKGRVVCASGHLIELAKPEDYDPRYAQWSIDDLPIIPDAWRLKEIEAKKRWLDSIRKGVVGATEMVVATDAGREGEYIAWLIINHLGLQRLPKMRLWTSGANQAAITRAVSNLLEYTDKYMLAEAAQIRAESDWIEGMNLSRLFTKRFSPPGHQEPISIGRVQTATLAIIVRRHREIREFKPREYRELSIRVTAGIHSVTLHHRPPESDRIYDGVEALEMCRRVNNMEAPVIVESDDRAERPPTLFESSSLQIRAYNLWGWPAERTETVAQALYEEHKLISYPRTDGVHLADEQWHDVKTTLGNIAGTPGFSGVSLRDAAKFVDLADHVPPVPIKRNSVFSSELLEKSGADHHGIVPTVEKADLSKLNADEQRLYALIVRQYLAQFLPDCQYEQRRISWTAGGIEFSANGRNITAPGWRVLFSDIDEAAARIEQNENEAEDEDQVLPPIERGAMGTGSYPKVITKVTRAPRQYTEGSIIAVMRNLSTLAKDAETKAILQAASTIGTKSTWGETIKKLKERLYIISSKGKLSPTALGEDLIGFCDTHVPKLVSIETTATLERMLMDVERGLMDTDKARRYLQTRNINAIKQCLAAPDMTLRAPEGGAKRAPGAKPRTYSPFADFPQGSWAVDIPVDAQAQREEAKRMGARFNGETKRWHIPKDRATESDLRQRGWLQ